MKLLKSFLVIMLVSIITFSCKKSDKKDAADATEEVSEALENATDDVADASEDVMDTIQKMESEDVDAVSEEAATATGEVKKEAFAVNYPKDTKLAGEVNEAIKDLVAGNPALKEHFSKAYGYAIFPKITKAGLGVGGAGGKGLVFQNDKVIGSAKMAQATLGLQAGAQQYAEVVFFENKDALDKFKSGKLKFSGQASAVALKEGASVDIAYQDGVAIFTKIKGGVMAEASLGGQKFSYSDGI
jgi:lipid-binding SYLF domain-containing protein